MLQGEVSVLAHSLGSVLCYDILCNQPHLYAALRHRQGKDAEHTETKLACFGSMQPMQSSDLDPSKTLQVGSASKSRLMVNVPVWLLTGENDRGRLIAILSPWNRKKLL